MNIKNLTTLQFNSRVAAIKAGTDVDFHMALRFAQTALCKYHGDENGNPKLVQYAHADLAKFKGRNAWANNLLRVANLIRRKAGSHLAFSVVNGNCVYAEVEDGSSITIAEIKIEMVKLVDASVKADTVRAEKVAKREAMSDQDKEIRSVKGMITRISTINVALLPSEDILHAIEGLEKELVVLKAAIKPKAVKPAPNKRKPAKAKTAKPVSQDKLEELLTMNG